MSWSTIGWMVLLVVGWCVTTYLIDEALHNMRDDDDKR